MTTSFKKNLFVLVFFIFLSVVFTCPLVFKMDSAIPGYGTTDEPLAATSYLWTVKYCSLHKIGLSNCNFVAYPFGMDFQDYTGSSYLWQFIKNSLTFLRNESFAFSFLVFLSFILSGWFAYLLVYYVSGSNFAALFSGVIFAFSPYHFSRAWQHLSLSQIQLLPLYLLGLFLLKEKSGKKSFLFMIAVFFILNSVNFYYAYFMVISAVTFIGFCFFNKSSNFKPKLHFLLSFVSVCLISLILISPSLLEIYKEKSQIGPNTPLSHNIINRPFEDLFSQSARPLSYFLPATVHPIIGGFTERFLGSSLYGESLTEHALYLGWIPLILAFIAFNARKKIKKETGASCSRESFYIDFFVLLAAVAWLFSQPPWWNFLGLKIYMPSFFMFKILPMFRAYCRFGIVVMLAVSVLAGFGLKFVLGKCKTFKLKISITAIFCCLVIFEFWNWPPYKVIDISKAPAVYYWLKKEPQDLAIAEYPLDVDTANVMYKFYQTKHEKRVINGTMPGTYANNVARTIVKLSDPQTAAVLKWMGVKYVLVHRQDYLDTDLLAQKEELDKIPANRGLQLIRSFPGQECSQKNMVCLEEAGPIDAYEVVSSPAEPEVKK